MERLSFFPTPYPDECFYSIFARYYVRSGISSPKEACTKFFGCDRSLLASTVLLPRRLERMDYWIDPECGLTSKELICRHTSYPYQSVAYTDNLYREIEKIIKEGVPETGMYPLERRMIAKSNCPGSGQYLRYCPECVRNDIRKYGETYWHRRPSPRTQAAAAPYGSPPARASRPSRGTGGMSPACGRPRRTCAPSASR